VCRNLERILYMVHGTWVFGGTCGWEYGNMCVCVREYRCMGIWVYVCMCVRCTVRTLGQVLVDTVQEVIRLDDPRTLQQRDALQVLWPPQVHVGPQLSGGFVAQALEVVVRDDLLASVDRQRTARHERALSVDLLHSECEPVHLSEPLHRRGVGVLGLALLLLAVVCEERRVTGERHSNLDRQSLVLA
jgi:hypothetical protein